jgi:hypothetical protein
VGTIITIHWIVDRHLFGNTGPGLLTSLQPLAADRVLVFIFGLAMYSCHTMKNGIDEDHGSFIAADCEELTICGLV